MKLYKGDYPFHIRLFRCKCRIACGLISIVCRRRHLDLVPTNLGAASTMSCEVESGLWNACRDAEQREACPCARLVGRYSRRGEIIGPSNEAIPEIVRRTDLHSRTGRRRRRRWRTRRVRCRIKWSQCGRSSIMTFLHVARAWLPMAPCSAPSGMTPRRLAEDDNCWHLRIREW